MKLEELSFADLWALSQYMEKVSAQIREIIDVAPDDEGLRHRLHVLGDKKRNVERELRARIGLEQSA